MNKSLVLAFSVSISLATAAEAANCTVEIEQNGREEPKYVGIQGYLIPGKSYSPSGYNDALPSYPWVVHTLVQVGPEKWGKGDETLPAKTSVVVVKQHLKHARYGRYEGTLIVKSLKDQVEYRIDVDNFTPSDYWNCPPHQAIHYSPFIAKAKDSAKPIDRQGRWVSMGEQKVFCTRKAPHGSGIEGVECHVYYGSLGSSYLIFPSDALEIIY